MRCETAIVGIKLYREKGQRGKWELMDEWVSFATNTAAIELPI